MKSVFVHPIFEIFITLLLVGHLFWNLSMIIYAGNMMALIPASIQLLVLILLLFRSSFLSYSIKIWAVLFMVTGVVGIGSKTLLQIARETAEFSMMYNSWTLSVGILLWFIAAKKIRLIDRK
ncbi:MAG: hypothetical protein KJP00_00280 [Bacteroidia bacterium]|nr:hypothetical protein [Bacteroidia bacterium]